MQQRERDRFLVAAQLAGALAVRPEVAARWTQGSACEGMSVGGLAHHLASQLGNTVKLVGADASDQTPIPLAEHYAEAASGDLPTPEFPDEVLLPVLALLTTVSLRRHGQDALVRALSRPQRSPRSISAF